MKHIQYRINQLKFCIENFIYNIFIKIISKPKKCQSSNRILVIRTGGLGDFLFATPAISRLRKITNKKIYLITDGVNLGGKFCPTPWSEMLRPTMVDQIHPLDRRSLVHFLTGLKRLRAEFSGDFDSVILLNHPLESFKSVMLRFFLILLMPIRVGRIVGAKGERLSNIFRKHHKSWWGAEHKVNGPIHAINEFSTAVKGLSIDEIESIKLLGEDFDKIPIPSPIILISPESKLAFKAWPLDKYHELVKYLLQKYDSDIWLVGGSDESNFSLNCLLESSRVKDMRKKLSIRQLIQIQSRVKFTVTQDGGLAHLISMSGGCLVNIANTIEEPGVVTPLGGTVVEVRHVAACSPCFGMDKCIRNDPVCVYKVSVNEVIDGINQLHLRCEQG
jgi:ADP-heptose:LPS heptosyltransferase